MAFAELHPQATRMVAADFLRRVLEKLLDKAHTVLTDNGVQFTLQPHQWFPGGHSFARICRVFGVEHRLTKPAHPWTNGWVERMNRTLKEATVQRYHYQTTSESAAARASSAALPQRSGKVAPCATLQPPPLQ